MDKKQVMIANRILLGLLMLGAGLVKLFVMGPEAVTGMLLGIVLFSWAASFWAWVLILAEIGSGVAILANYRLKDVAFVPAIILVVAAFTANWPGFDGIIGPAWSGLFMHLALASNYLLLRYSK